MNEPAVSVIVVSRGRPAALKRCLWGIEQLFYRNFELIVVADPAGMASAKRFGLPSIKLVPFDRANISAARNAGLEVATGEIVAFIDDDAVPEPTWLSKLVEPFADPAVMSAGGYVRGRNGISYQSKGSWVDGALTESIEDAPGVFDTSPRRALKTVGTNCAFRRDQICHLGGFDPVFRFYLDETDLNMRLAASGHKAALVPGAQVHHGFMASAYRTSSRVPKSLYEIGASVAAFLRKHGQSTFEPHFEQVRTEQRRRLTRHFVAGNCVARDIDRLLRSLENGFVAGQFRPIAALEPRKASQHAFQRFTPRAQYSAPRIITGRGIEVSLQPEARLAAARGERISLFLFSPTLLFHRVEFKDGYWLQTGGFYGRSNRSDPLFKPWRRATRIAHEIARVAEIRGFSKSQDPEFAIKKPFSD